MKTTLDKLCDDLETLAAWKEDLGARIARAEICFQSSVGLSDERREELLHEGRAWHRAANALVKRVASKVETPAIRARMVSHLLNVDADLARTVAEGLRLKPMPKAADAAMPTKELEPSPKLSILLNGPNSFKGRKLGALVTDGVDIGLLKALYAALESEGALIEIVSPMVGGVEASDGTWVEGKQMLGGGPSVLYDAVAVLASPGGSALLAKDAAAKDFVSDAFAHCKFIAYSADAMPLFEKAGVALDLDAGCIELSAAEDARRFVEMCRELRFWEQEPKVKR